MLVKRGDLDLLGGASFETYKNSDHKILSASIRLDKAKCRMSGLRKFNSSLLDEKDFRDQLELMLKWELMAAIIANKWWGKLKDRIRSFAVEYSKRLNLDKIAKQRLIEDKPDRMVKVGDNGATNTAKVELASFQIKKYQALVVRARLKRMSWEVTKMAQELWVKELRYAVDRHITSVTSLDE